MWVSLSSWLSPGRPRLLAEECMGLGSFIKGNFLSGLRDSPGLHFFMSPVSVKKVGFCYCCFVSCVMALPSGSERNTEEGRGPHLKLWLIYCMSIKHWVSWRLVRDLALVYHSAGIPESDFSNQIYHLISRDLGKSICFLDRFKTWHHPFVFFLAPSVILGW